MINKKYVMILDIMIKPCLEADEQFILKENRNEAYGTNALVNELVRK